MARLGLELFIHSAGLDHGPGNVAILQQRDIIATNPDCVLTIIGASFSHLFQPATRRERRKKLVLIVDDEEPLRVMMGLLLKKSGFKVLQEGTAYWVQDLGSTNGLTVNGRRQQRAKLGDGDRITVGSTELVFHRAAQ